MSFIHCLNVVFSERSHTTRSGAHNGATLAESSAVSCGLGMSQLGIETDLHGAGEVNRSLFLALLDVTASCLRSNLACSRRMHIFSIDVSGPPVEGHLGFSPLSLPTTSNNKAYAGKVNHDYMTVRVSCDVLCYIIFAIFMLSVLFCQALCYSCINKVVL